jgi:hypothetical protein
VLSFDGVIGLIAEELPKKRAIASLRRQHTAACEFALSEKREL